jgi:HK97 family phage prohead protease
MSQINFVASPVTLDAAASEDAPRTITGVAVPWDTPATVSGGERVQFTAGAFDTEGKRPKLLEGHDMTQLRGVVSELVNADEGLLFTATFAKTRAADDAVELIKAGAYDSVSVGAIPVKYKYDKNGTMVVSQAELIEISLVAQPAFKDAVITEIAASQPDDDETPTPDIPEEEPMSTETTPTPAVEAAVVPTTPLLAAQPARPFVMPGMGEYVAKFLKGGAEFVEFNARIKAAAPDVTTTDTPGLLPDPIVGPVYTNLIANFRPVVNAFGVRAMPQGSGKQFQIPYVATHTTIGASNGENVALDAGQYVVDSLTVEKAVEGGYVRLSEEDMDWTSPEVLQGLLEDMARRYAYRSDDVAADALVTGTTNTNNFTSANIADPTEWITWIYTAASDILSGSNGHLPDHLFLAPNRWASLGQLEDGSGRPLFPQVGPMNAYGALSPNSDAGNAFGLRVVVDANLASGTLLIGSTTDGAFRFYEQNKGAISVEAADGSLSRYIKFRGYVATAMVDSTKFIKAAFV